MGSSLVAQWAKDLASLLWYRFHPWPGNFHMVWVWPEKRHEVGVGAAFSGINRGLGQMDGGSRPLPGSDLGRLLR